MSLTVTHEYDSGNKPSAAKAAPQRGTEAKPCP